MRCAERAENQQQEEKILQKVETYTKKKKKTTRQQQQKKPANRKQQIKYSEYKTGLFPLWLSSDDFHLPEGADLYPDLSLLSIPR